MKEKEVRDEYHPLMKQGLFNFTGTLAQMKKDMDWVEEHIFKDMEETIANMTTFMTEVEETLALTPLHQDPHVWYEDVYSWFQKVYKKLERLMKTKWPRPKNPDVGSPEFFEEMFKKHDEELEIEGMTPEQVKEF